MSSTGFLLPAQYSAWVNCSYTQTTTDTLLERTNRDVESLRSTTEDHATTVRHSYCICCTIRVHPYSWHASKPIDQKADIGENLHACWLCDANMSYDTINKCNSSDNLPCFHAPGKNKRVGDGRPSREITTICNTCTRINVTSY